MRRSGIGGSGILSPFFHPEIDQHQKDDQNRGNHKKKWPGYQGVNDKPFHNPFSCHPERSEGSQPVKNTRFFAPLRMTD
jgi:hypothetical protein